MAAPFSAELTVEAYLAGVRIDSFLVKHFRNYTTWRMQRIIRAGAVTVDGVRAESVQRVFRGQRVGVVLIEPPDKLHQPEPAPLEILFEDPWLIVVNKPAGRVVHPVAANQTGTLANALQSHCDRQSVHRGILRPSFVHRIDRETSGVIVCTKDHLAHRRMSIQFQKGQVEKTYLALVEGVVDREFGSIDRPIGQLPGGKSILMTTDTNARNRRPARTDYRIMRRFEAATLLEVKPVTGRIHQIRVHLAAEGHPVVGDQFYGSNSAVKSDRQIPGQSVQASVSESSTTPVRRHALHAYRLRFVHPITRERVQFVAAVPVDFRDALCQFAAHSLSG